MDRDTLRRMDPEWAEVEREIPGAERWWPAAERMLRSDPRLGNRFAQMHQVDRAASYQWALLRLGSEAQKIYGPMNGPSWRDRQEAAHASIPQTLIGESRRVSRPSPSEQIAKLKVKAKQTGLREDRDAFVKARLRQTIVHPDLDFLEGKTEHGTIPVESEPY